jgi:hypothetical protein
MDNLLNIGKKNLGKLVKAGAGMSSHGNNGYNNSSENQYYRGPPSNYVYPGSAPHSAYQPMNYGNYQQGYPPQYNFGPNNQNQPFRHPSQMSPYAIGGSYQTNLNYPPPPPPQTHYQQQNMQMRPHTSKSSPLNVLDLDHDGMVTVNGKYL